MYTALILDYGFAWLAVMIGIFLLFKYFLRKWVQNSKGNRRHILAKTNRSWKYPHIVLGFVLVIVGLVHGIYSSVSVVSLNLGTLNWLVIICFGITWLGKGFLRKRWLYLHRGFAVIFTVLLVWHVIDVGGIHALRILSEIRERPQYPIAEHQINPDTSSEKDDQDQEDDQLPYYFAFDSLKLADGTYQAEGTGYSPGLKVEVTIKDNQVTAIKVLEHYELDSKYYKLPLQKIPEDIVSKQTLDVDMVSGASMTSVGLIKAVRKAVLESIVK